MPVHYPGWIDYPEDDPEAPPRPPGGALGNVPRARWDDIESPTWADVRGQIPQAAGPGGWGTYEQQLRGVLAPGVGALDPRVQAILSGGARFTDVDDAAYDHLRGEYFGEGGLIPSIKGRWGEYTGRTLTSTPGERYGALAGELDPAIAAATAELGTGADTTLGRLTDLYDEAVGQVSAFDPTRYGARRRADAEAAVAARTRDAIDRVGAGRAGLESALRLRGALAGAAQGVLGQTQGEVAGAELQGAALQRAIGAASGIGEHRLGAAGALGSILAQREAALREGRTTEMAEGRDLTGAWRAALADWGSTIGNRLSMDLGAWNAAVSADTARMGQQAATDRANAGILGAGWQRWFGATQAADLANAAARQTAWGQVFGSAARDRQANAQGRYGASAFNAGQGFQASQAALDRQHQWRMGQAQRDWIDRRERDEERRRNMRGLFPEITSTSDPNRTGVFDLGRF